MESNGQGLPVGTVTFLFSDIEESTRLVETLSTSDYRDVIEQHHRILREAFSDHGGLERGTEGDSFLVVFTEAPSAIRAAVSAQRALGLADWAGASQVRVRMGLHTGLGELGGDDYIGIDINRAARISSAAHGGQILVSGSTRALAERSLEEGVEFRDLGEYQLKGIERPERVFQLVGEGIRADFPPIRTNAIGEAHVPRRLTSFVTRPDETADVGRLLENSRLVTLTGPGERARPVSPRSWADSRHRPMPTAPGSWTSLR